jgi:hypothetical protein
MGHIRPSQGEVEGTHVHDQVTQLSDSIRLASGSVGLLLATSRAHEHLYHRGRQIVLFVFGSQFSRRSHGPSPIMNYGKKDEDADSGLVKVDRTQVFQEGEFAQNRPKFELSMYGS